MTHTKRFYRVRAVRHGGRVFIHARGYRDALKIQAEYGGRIVASK